MHERWCITRGRLFLKYANLNGRAAFAVRWRLRPERSSVSVQSWFLVCVYNQKCLFERNQATLNRKKLIFCKTLSETERVHVMYVNKTCVAVRLGSGVK